MPTADPGGARADPGTLLLLSRPGDAAAEVICGDHLATHDDPEAAPLVVLTDRPVAELPERRGHAVVVVGSGTRSAAASADPPPADPEPRATPVTVVAAGDLGSAGGTVDAYLTSWSASGHRPAVCVDSVTGLLEEASIPATYRFLYVLLRRVDALGCVAHAHADPRDQEEEILRTFSSLFDRVVSVRDGGGSRG